MNRRDWMLLTSAGMYGAAAAVSAAPSSQDAHHAAAGYDDLIDTASRCVVDGNACLSHCVAMLGKGDTELADCARTVRDVIAACGALQELAAADSPHARAFARLVGQVCADCEAECHKHEQHPVCRDCEQACRDCRAACEHTA